jgi:hypothetical protein
MTLLKLTDPLREANALPERTVQHSDVEEAARQAVGVNQKHTKAAVRGLYAFIRQTPKKHGTVLINGVEYSLEEQGDMIRIRRASGDPPQSDRN